MRRLIYLTLHGVGPVPRPLDPGERRCWLETEELDALLDLVQRHPNVRLTVDDGNESDYGIVLPALLGRNLEATFFVCADRLDRPSFLGRRQVRELIARGMSVGSHGSAHVAWRHLRPAQLRYEVVDSRRRLEDACGTAISEAACPFGSYGRRTLGALRSEGYRAVYTSDGGSATAAQWLRARTTVTRGTRVEDMGALLHERAIAVSQVLVDLRKLAKRFRP